MDRIHGRWWLVFLGWLGCVLWLVGLPPDAFTFLGRPLARVTVALQAFHRHRWRIGACSPVFRARPATDGTSRMILTHPFIVNLSA